MTRTIRSPHISERKSHTFIDVPPSRQGDGESTTFHSGKRIPPAIPKLRRSSACVNRHPGQAGTACDLWEQTVTLLETIPSASGSHGSPCRVGVRARISDLPSGSHRDIRISVEGAAGPVGAQPADGQLTPARFCPADGACSHAAAEEPPRHPHPAPPPLPPSH